MRASAPNRPSKAAPMRAAHSPCPRICCTVCALVNARFLSICWTCVRTAPINGSGLLLVRTTRVAKGDVGDRLWVFPDLTNDCGSHNTNNLEQFWFLHDREAFSEWFLARPDSLGHGFIDDGYASRVFTIEIRKVAATYERDAHGRKVAWRHVVKIDEGAAIIGVGLLAFAKNGAREAAGEHAVRGHGGTHHSGDSLGALNGVAEELLPVIGVITQEIGRAHV